MSGRKPFSFKEVTTTIPIVSLMDDPVRVGLVASMARPGGNITGVAIDQGINLFEKRFELLKQAVPRISKLGLLISRAYVEKIIRGGSADVEERLYWQYRIERNMTDPTLLPRLPASQNAPATLRTRLRA
jgi:ABC transporter substrate binding protein